MTYTTKFDMGQTVWIVSRAEHRRIVKCLTCESVGKIHIGGEEFVCPKCCGASSYPQYAGSKAYIAHTGVIGKISVEHEPSAYDGKQMDISYMIDVTGIGSGTVWREENVFPTREAAQQHCDSANFAVPEDDPDAIAHAKMY